MVDSLVVLFFFFFPFLFPRNSPESRKLGGKYSYISLTFCYRDPYSFFHRVVSRASKPDGILARLQFGLPIQKGSIIYNNYYRGMVKEILFNLDHF